MNAGVSDSLRGKRSLSQSMASVNSPRQVLKIQEAESEALAAQLRSSVRELTVSKTQALQYKRQADDAHQQCSIQAQELRKLQAAYSKLESAVLAQLNSAASNDAETRELQRAFKSLRRSIGGASGRMSVRTSAVDRWSYGDGMPGRLQPEALLAASRMTGIAPTDVDYVGFSQHMRANRQHRELLSMRSATPPPTGTPRHSHSPTQSPSHDPSSALQQQQLHLTSNAEPRHDVQAAEVEGRGNGKGPLLTPPDRPKLPIQSQGEYENEEVLPKTCFVTAQGPSPRRVDEDMGGRQHRTRRGSQQERHPPVIDTREERKQPFEFHGHSGEHDQANTSGEGLGSSHGGPPLYILRPSQTGSASCDPTKSHEDRYTCSQHPTSSERSPVEPVIAQAGAAAATPSDHQAVQRLMERQRRISSRCRHIETIVADIGAAVFSLAGLQLQPHASRMFLSTPQPPASPPLARNPTAGAVEPSWQSTGAHDVSEPNSQHGWASYGPQSSVPPTSRLGPSTPPAARARGCATDYAKGIGGDVQWTAPGAGSTGAQHGVVGADQPLGAGFVDSNTFASAMRFVAAHAQGQGQDGRGRSDTLRGQRDIKAPRGRKQQGEGRRSLRRHSWDGRRCLGARYSRSPVAEPDRSRSRSKGRSQISPHRARVIDTAASRLNGLLWSPAASTSTAFSHGERRGTWSDIGNSPDLFRAAAAMVGGSLKAGAARRASPARILRERNARQSTTAAQSPPPARTRKVWEPSDSEFVWGQRDGGGGIRTEQTRRKIHPPSDMEFESCPLSPPRRVFYVGSGKGIARDGTPLHGVSAADGRVSK